MYICTINSKYYYEYGYHSSDYTCQASPPTKCLGFRGFDSSKLLVLKGGNSHVRIIL